MKNLEQKFRCNDLAAAIAAAIKLGAIDRGTIHQHDYFFAAPHARLKLRLINGRDTAELIAYRRPDADAPTTSEYFITPIAHPDPLLSTLALALGKPRELVKTRRLFIYKSTRIHVDKIDNLGTFVELEALLVHNSSDEAQAELDVVVAGLDLKDPIAPAYVDLLQ